MIVVIAKVIGKKTTVEDLKNLLESLVAPTLKENGCIQYILHQDTEQENIFFFYENWENAEALKAHSNTDRFKQFLKEAEALTEKPMEVSVLNKIS